MQAQVRSCKAKQTKGLYLLTFSQPAIKLLAISGYTGQLDSCTAIHES